MNNWYSLIMNLRKPVKSSFSWYPVVGFVALAYGVTWGTKVLHALLSESGAIPTFNVVLIGQYGPMLAALAVVSVCYGTAGLRTIGSRLFKWKGTWGWLVLAFLFEPLIFLGIALLCRLTGGDPEPAVDVSLLPSVGTYLTTFTGGLLFWGLSEEIGWRGYLLPVLQERFSPFAASLILAVIITFWHMNPNMPESLYVFQGGQYIWGRFPVMVERLVISIPIVFVTTWMFNRSGGTLPVMMVFHSASNTSYFWVKGVFGSVESDMFKLGFLVSFWVAGIIFGILVFRMKGRSGIVQFQEHASAAPVVQATVT